MEVKEILLRGNNLQILLEHFNFSHIKDRGKEIRCARSKDSNPTAICVFKNENITVCDYARGYTGDIFTLLMNEKKMTFREVIVDIRKLFNIEVTYKVEAKEDKLTNVFKDVLLFDEETLDLYNENILDIYEDRWSYKFLKDGISAKTQKKFNIMYDTETNRILIPHRDKYGELCGLVGRINYEASENIPKYLAMIPFKKNLCLFGYCQNYEYLLNADVIYIGEAEKFVMQLDTMNIHTALSLSGSSISKEQILLIMKLNPKKVIFCFDEGLKEEIMFNSINRFKLISQKSNIKVGYIIDKENKYLKLGSKDSPSDLGLETFKSLLSDCYYEI